MLGKVRTSEKQWIRYLVTETLKEAIDKARRKGDLKNMVAAADKLANTVGSIRKTRSRFLTRISYRRRSNT